MNTAALPSTAAAPQPFALAAGGTLTLALSKGRIFDESLPLLARLGIAPAGDVQRLLRVPTTVRGLSLLIIRATDVPTYVEHGAADLGIVGKDVLMEHGGNGLYEPLDLGIAKCRLSVAAPKGFAPAPPGTARRLRVATKYPAITRRHYAAKGEQVEIIKLYGSMELAPLVGLADVIVDLVATGATLAANGLAEIEPVAAVSSRLVVNKAAMKMQHAAIAALVARFAEAVAAPGPGSARKD